jgi:hypothetical protein
MVKSIHSHSTKRKAQPSSSVRYVTDEDFSKTVASIRSMSNAQLIQSFKDVGILTQRGKLAIGYRRG